MSMYQLRFVSFVHLQNTRPVHWWPATCSSTVIVFHHGESYKCLALPGKAGTQETKETATIHNCPRPSLINCWTALQCAVRSDCCMPPPPLSGSPCVRTSMMVVMIYVATPYVCVQCCLLWQLMAAALLVCC